MNLNIYKKTAFITGASRGLGKEIAKEIAKTGLFKKIIITARDIAELEQTADEITKTAPDTDITIAPVDLSKFIQINELCAHIHSNFKHIDLFISCAAMLGDLTPIEQTTIEQWQETMHTNLDANFYLLKGLHPLFARAKSAKVIFITSSEGKEPKPFFGAYAISKAALEHMVSIYNNEQKNISKIIATCIDPGIMATKLRAKAFPGENQNDLQSASNAAKNIVNQFIINSNKAASIAA